MIELFQVEKNDEQHRKHILSIRLIKKKVELLKH